MSDCAKCDGGWIEIDDMPYPCRHCNAPVRKPAQPGPVDRYLAELAEAMGLGDWVLVIADEPADEGTIAEIDCTLGQRHARIYLCENWLDLDAATQRDTLVHELVHAHHAQLRHMVESLTATVKGGKQIQAALELVEEYATEAIAQAWAPMLPLPVAERKKGKK